METGRVSVVVSCYNYGKYLSGCLDSILCQTYQNFEILVVNDGSTDNTEEIIKPYLKNNKVKYYKQNNSGQTVTKNNGIKYSTGEYIAFLDADDIWDKTKLEKQVGLFSEKETGVVYSRMNFIDEEGKPVNSSDDNKYLFPKSGNVTSKLFFDNFIPFSSSIVRRECFEKCGCFDESLKMGIDWDLWLRFSVDYRFSYVDEPLLIYRVGHSGQMSKNLEERQRCSDRIMNKFVEQNPCVLSKSTIKKAWAYTYGNRGNYFYNSDARRSVEFYLLSIREWPIQFVAYKNLLKRILRSLIRKN